MRTNGRVWEGDAVRLAIAFVLSASSFGFGQAPPGPRLSAVPASADVLIIHDSRPGPAPAGRIVANNVTDLLGHFGLKSQVVALEDYVAGELNRYRFTFVLGVDDRKVTYPAALLNDAKTSTKPLMWINRHIFDLLGDPQFVARTGLTLGKVPVLLGYDHVNYKGHSLLKNEPSLLPIEVADPSRVRVLATAAGEKAAERPYVVQSGSFWYFADSPFAFAEEGDRYWVFCDLLHDFLGVPHQEERKALVRIEDVSVEDDPEELIWIADYLHGRGIPFQVSLIPIYKDPQKNEEIFLSDRPQFVRAIRYMVSKGGLIVMHGVTHQSRGKSADDFEFWDELSNKPIPGDQRAVVENKLRVGLAECFKNGIYPVTWETPHYMASESVYRTVARYFNSSWDRIPAVDSPESGHHVPYPVVDRYGRFIIPECLGYISIDNPDPDLLIANAGRLPVVRDGVAAFFIHPFLDRGYLEKVVDGIQEAGYRFISIRGYDCRLQMENWLTQTYTDEVDFPVKGMYLHRLLLHADGRRSAESYSGKPLTAVVKDPGIVPPDAVLVMEAVPEIVEVKEEAPPSVWDRFASWVRAQMPGGRSPGAILSQPEAVVLWDDTLTKGDWNNQQSYRSALAAFGFRVSAINWKDAGKALSDPESVVIVPRATATKLSSRQVEQIAAFVKDGGHAVLEGPTPLSAALGVVGEKRSIKVQRVDESLYGARKSELINSFQEWNPPAEVERFSLRSPQAVYVRASDSELPLALLGRLGKGMFIYFAARLDPHTPLGYSRYPYLVHYLISGFGLKLPAEGTQLEVYFDPGHRQGIDIERLAEQWRRLGVRAIYAAAYQFWPTWSYDYKRLIEVCHRNGILVYAWFELPHVSKKFWDDHPEWVARTATGAEGQVGWRYHMDLDIPECRDAVLDFVDDLLKAYPWDGINVAELNFDTDNGPENPAKYLPMGDSTRAAFRALGGFDPKLLFQPDSPYYWKTNPGALKRFEDYRSGRVFAWHRAVLDRVTPLAQERDMEIIVTMLDSLHSKTLKRDTGVDSTLIVGLMDKYPFTLQVEDPAPFWSESPERYRRFATTYTNLVKDRRRLMFDVNVVPARNLSASHSPSQTLVGTELAQNLIFAGEASGRAALYSEGTIPFEDMQYLSRVLGRTTRIDRSGDSWITESDRSVFLLAPGMWQNFHVDGRIWPGWGENSVFIPAGRHTISAAERRFRIFDTSVLDIRLLRFTGNLDSLEPTTRGLAFSYDSYPRTAAVLNRRPFEIRIDGQPYPEDPVQYSGSWAVRLPRGRHTVELIADSTAYVILDTTSLYSSWLIVIFGIVAIGLMVLIYMSVLVRRAFSRAVHGKAAQGDSGVARP